MGTRSLTYVYGKNDEPIICMYRQFDGYLSGHGADLAQFLDGFEIVNGLTGDESRKVANGMGCLAAQMVAYFKVGAGNFYLHHPKLDRDDWQEYEYHISENKIVVKNPSDVIFEGSWPEFVEACNSKSIEG